MRFDHDHVRKCRIRLKMPSFLGKTCPLCKWTLLWKWRLLRMRRSARHLSIVINKQNNVLLFPQFNKELNMASVHLEVFVRHSSYWHKKRGRSANHREMWSRLAHNSAPNRWPVCLNPVSSCVDFMGQLFHSRQFYTLHELLLWKLCPETILSAHRVRRGF